MNAQELLDLKQEINDSKDAQIKLEGRKEAILERLQKEYGVKTIAAAEKKIEKLNKEIEQLDADIETATQDLEDRLEQEQDSRSEE